MRLAIVALVLSLVSIPSWSETQVIRIATWNMEHFAEENGKGCRPRTTRDYKAIKDYIEFIDADIYALQEVQNTKALTRVFDPYEFDLIVSPRPTPEKTYVCRGTDSILKTEQRVAYAVRKTINYSYSPKDNLTELARNPSLRYGLALSLPDLGGLTLLNVHLKSGCFSNSDHKSNHQKLNCATKTHQFDDLSVWKNEHSEKYLMILGDFNRRLSQPADVFRNHFTAYHFATDNMSSCHPRYPELIDHIASNFNSGLAQTYPFYDLDNDGVDDKTSTMLSDHCAISVDLRFKK